MRKTYHLCLSSHDEVFFRDQEDFNFGFNCLACAAKQTESRLIGEGFMSTHVHTGIQSDCWKELAEKSRYGYVRYFNSKYGRNGKLGEKHPFVLQVEGLKHTLTMLSYVYRQPLHHGICSTPFEYRNSSANSIFRKELGKNAHANSIKDCHKSKYLPGFVRGRNFSGCRMTADGLLFREDIIDTDYVEELFITPRNFLYYMNRISDKKWLDEQLEDKIGGEPIKLSTLEPEDYSVEKMLLNESGRIDKSWMSDEQLCELIDNDLLPHFNNGDNGLTSIYMLPRQRRKDLGNHLWSLSKSGGMVDPVSGAKKYVTKEQIIRCAAINY